LQPLKTEINGHVFNRPWVLAPYIGRQHYFYFSIMSREEDVLLYIQWFHVFSPLLSNKHIHTRRGALLITHCWKKSLIFLI